MKTLAIFTPAYNRAHTLPRTYASLLRQTCKDFLWLIVDDGSSVSPMNGLMKYSDDIIYVRQKNQGLSMARNQGIDIATGIYLQFVDADDHLLCAPYEHNLDIIRKNGDIDMVLFDFTNSNIPTQTEFKDLPVMSGAEYMLSHNIRGTACGYLFKHTALSELRFTAGIWHEDEEFTPQMLIRAEQVYVTNAKAYYYYKHPGTITTQADDESSTKRLNDLIGVIQQLRELCNRVQQDKRDALKRRVAQLSMDYIYQVIVQKHSVTELENRIEQLRDMRLFPLPNCDYSQKYKWFRAMTNSALGRRVLLHTLPLLKKER